MLQIFLYVVTQINLALKPAVHQSSQTSNVFPQFKVDRKFGKILNKGQIAYAGECLLKNEDKNF